MKLYRNFIILIFSSLIISCRSDKPEKVDPVTSINILPSQGVFILNEGNFMWGNASVDYYKSYGGNLSSDLFKGVNNKALGDVLQSMSVYNGKGYLVVNNSGKIEVVDPASFKSIGTVSGLKSPRYFIGVSASKAYVSDYKSNAISVIDLNTLNKVKEISCAGWTEEMVMVGNRVFVTNLYKDYLYVVDAVNDKLEDSIKVGYGSGSVVLDKNSKLWVLSSGDVNQNVKPALSKVNPTTFQIEQSFQFANSSDSPYKLRINGSKDFLYYLNSGVYRMTIDDSQLPTTAEISGNSHVFYGLGIDPNNGEIYVADAIDYVQKGKVYCYDTNGILITYFNVGIIPSGFYFY